MTVVIIAVVAGLLVGVVMHEAGHWYAMRRDGVRIVAAGLGWPLPPMLKIRRRGVKWTLSPWLFGAYVEPHHDDHHRIDDGPYRTAAWHYNAGIVVNLAFGLAAVAVASAMQGRWLFAAVQAVLAALTVAYRRAVAAYVLPALALPALAAIGWAVGSSMVAGDPIGFSAMGDLPVRPGAAYPVNVFGAASLALAWLNALPFYPFDNGRVCARAVRAWVGDRAEAVFMRVGTALALTLIAASFGDDLLRLTGVL